MKVRFGRFAFAELVTLALLAPTTARAQTAIPGPCIDGGTNTLPSGARWQIPLHTRGDEVVPFWHEPLYAAKVFLTGHSGVLPLPVDRYGHCNFTTTELLGAFALAVQ